MSVCERESVRARVRATLYLILQDSGKLALTRMRNSVPCSVTMRDRDLESTPSSLHVITGRTVIKIPTFHCPLSQTEQMDMLMGSHYKG